MSSHDQHRQIARRRCSTTDTGAPTGALPLRPPVPGGWLCDCRCRNMPTSPRRRSERAGLTTTSFIAENAPATASGHEAAPPQHRSTPLLGEDFTQKVRSTGGGMICTDTTTITNDDGRTLESATPWGVHRTHADQGLRYRRATNERRRSPIRREAMRPSRRLFAG